MSDPQPPRTNDEDPPSKGPSLTLLYSLIALALLIAMGFAALIVLPFSWLSVLVALTAATLVGVIFGTVPATRAAQLDPVEALKYE